MGVTSAYSLTKEYTAEGSIYHYVTKIETDAKQDSSLYMMDMNGDSYSEDLSQELFTRPSFYYTTTNQFFLAGRLTHTDYLTGE
jgi:hypothetical protein